MTMTAPQNRGGAPLGEQSKLPARKELENDLARLREVSAGIDKMTKLLVTGELPADEVKPLIEEYVTEQSQIVDKFIELSNDWESMKHFADVVRCIETKTELIKSCSDSEEYKKLKKEVMDHIEEWIDCLELIVIGVIKRASR